MSPVELKKKIKLMGSEKCLSLIFGLRAILLEKTETLAICGLAL